MKEIEGYPDYFVDEKGNVFSKRVHQGNPNGKLRQLKAHKHDEGYSYVGLCVSGKQKNFYVHRLVAKAFIPNSENKPCINHKSGIKTDNRASNLEWCTYKENHTHSIKLGMTTNLLKSSKPVRQYTLDGELVAEFVSTKEASRITGINRCNISSVCLSNRSHAGGYIWRYKDTCLVAKGGS